MVPSQQLVGKEDLSLTTARKSILPTSSEFGSGLQDSENYKPGGHFDVNLVRP